MIGPLIQGSIRPIWSFTIIQDDNTSYDLTGATFGGVLYDTLKVGSKATLGGSFNITSASGGQFTYTPVAADVDEPGDYTIEITITISSNPTVVRDRVLIKEAYT